MNHLPIFLTLTGRDVLVVGGGEVAARKVALLRRAGAKVRVVAPDLGPALATEDIVHVAKHFEPDDLDGVVLVIAATDDRAVNMAVAAAANSRALPVNVVDDPDLCSFIMPAIVERGRITAAISTGGASPVLARLIRARLDIALPPGIERLADQAAAWREPVKAALPDGAARRRFWERTLGGAWGTRIMAGEVPALSAILAEPASSAGRLEIIDVPIDDPDALTLRAVKLIHAAELVLHDPAMPAEVLLHARRDAEIVSLPDVVADASSRAAATIEMGGLVVTLIFRRTDLTPKT